jgi:hypothetical protein
MAEQTAGSYADWQSRNPASRQAVSFAKWLVKETHGVMLEVDTAWIRDSFNLFGLGREMPHDWPAQDGLDLMLSKAPVQHHKACANSGFSLLYQTG